jgi:transcriptional regulator with XRE-family HTH domain
VSDRDAGAAEAVRSDLDAEEFGRRFRAARIAAGWPSGNQAAKAVGIIPSAYFKLEQGKQVPTLGRLMTIVRVLGLDPKILAPEWFRPRRGR